MAEKTRNLCAEIPLELHTKVRQRQAESGKTLSRYMTALITKFYEMEERQTMEKEVTRPVCVSNVLLLRRKLTSPSQSSAVWAVVNSASSN